MRKPLTPEMRTKVLELFKSGMGVNHIVFTLEYAWDVDDVNQVLRDVILELNES
jgi:hypothetical protein